MEEWVSPFLTKISREYCKNEFFHDTGDLLQHFETLNQSQTLKNEKVYLFTLDVKALYSSIQPELAFQVIRDVFATDKTTKIKRIHMRNNAQPLRWVNVPQKSRCSVTIVMLISNM